MSFIYVASPYTHEQSLMRQVRYRLVQQYLAMLHKEGAPCYSPIAHWHDVAVHHKLPGDINHWWLQNKAMLDSCHSLHVLCITGWDKSEGVAREIAYCKDTLRKKIEYVKF